MNKYEFALELIKESYAEGEFQYDYDEIYTISELVEKATPKKPTKNKYGVLHCPNCKEQIYYDTDYGQQKFNYCTECGQKLDWSE